MDSVCWLAVTPQRTTILRPYRSREFHRCWSQSRLLSHVSDRRLVVHVCGSCVVLHRRLAVAVDVSAMGFLPSLFAASVLEILGGLGLQLLAALCFACAGWYHVSRADYISEISVHNIRRLPRPLQVLFPVRWYGSKSFVWLTRAGGVLALLVSLFLFALFLFSIFRVVTRTI
jgi:hypothetical protein